jgi:hypothetical protein
MQKIIISLVCGMSVLIFALPVVAQAALNATDTPGQTNGSGVALIALYTQLLQLLQQELLALGGKAPSPAPPTCSPVFGNICLVNSAGVPIQPSGSGSVHSKKRTVSNSNSDAPTPAPYVAKAVHFDGNTLIAANTISTNDDGDLSYSFWAKSDGNWGFAEGWVSAPDTPANQDPFNNFFGINSGNQFISWLGDQANDPTLFFKATTSNVSTGQWHHFLVSTYTNVVAGSKSIKIYIDDVSAGTITEDDIPSFIPNINGRSFFVGGDVYGDNLAGDMADFWFAPGVSLIDGSGDIPTSTRRKFTTGNGKPVSPSNFPPGGAILFSGDAATFPQNQLSGGSLLVAGAPLSCTGRNGAGSVTLTGALIGQTVIHVYDSTSNLDVSTDFEKTISVINHIQQTGSTNYASDTLEVFLPGALTNASTSPSD